MKIVKNTTYGGFGVSEAAIRRLRELGQAEALAETLKGEKWPSTDEVNRIEFNQYGRSIPRDDLLLIQVIGELGEKADGCFAELEVVEVPDGIEWEIDDYDGIETIHETHRSW